MLLEKQSDIFKSNFNYWKLLAIWPGREPAKYYKYFSFTYLTVTLFIYIILLTINLLYTPMKMEMLIKEVTFYFSEINIVGKVATVLIMQEKINEAMDILDSEDFKPVDDVNKQIMIKANQNFKLFWKVLEMCGFISFCAQIIGVPLVLMLMGNEVALPVCNYYFLSEDIKNEYFKAIYFYQSFGMFGHMMYNINGDAFVTGAILMAITQSRVLNQNISGLKIDGVISELKIEDQDNIQLFKLNRCLRHYDQILQYCSTIQTIISTSMFLQFGIASVNICVVLCGFMMIPSTESFIFSLIFNLVYIVAIMSEIFIPGWLGTILSYESEQLVTAAYDCEWIPRSESFKRSLKLFMERAKTPVQLTGLSMFRLSLDTFISIMKTTYSFFTLLRFVLSKDGDSQ